MDITQFMSDFLDLLVTIFTKAYNILDSITFAGFSLLQYSITIVVLSVVLTLLFTLVSSSGISTARSYAIREKRSAKSRERRGK